MSAAGRSRWVARVVAAVVAVGVIVIGGAVPAMAAWDTWSDDNPDFRLRTLKAGIGGKPGDSSLYLDGYGNPGSYIYEGYVSDAEAATIRPSRSVVGPSGAWSLRGLRVDHPLSSSHFVNVTQVTNGVVTGRIAEMYWAGDGGAALSEEDWRNAPFTAGIGAITPDGNGTYTVTITGTGDVNTLIMLIDEHENKLGAQVVNEELNPMGGNGPLPDDLYQWEISVSGVAPGEYTWGARQFLGGTADAPFIHGHESDITGVHLNVIVGDLETPIVDPVIAAVTAGVIGAAGATGWVVRRRRGDVLG